MDLIGKTLGQYQIVEAIGHGGMASVFKARQPALDRFVAVKVLLPHQASTQQFRERFNREAKAVAQLNHPNILPVIDYGQDDDLNYIVMKYVPGGTLADRLKQPIDLVTTAQLISQIAAALDHAHKRGIIHRDIKPTNVLLDEGEWALLADFGLAKLLHGDQSLTGSGLSMGTPAYLSPEQGQGLPLDHHTDIYSLGVILYEMVTGRLPFNSETAMGVIIKHIYDQPPLPRALNPAIPEAVEAIVLKALAKRTEERFDSAGELANTLQMAVAIAPSMQFAPVQGVDSNATPHLNPQAGPPTPIVISNKVLFEETVPAALHFVGRTAELAAYHARLERDQLVIITGLAGVGKTTLGAKLARAVAASPDHIFWFTFDRVEKSTADALYWALASFLDNRGEPSLGKYLRGEIGAQKPLEQMAKINLLMAALATGRYVLCFDDFQIVKDVPEIAYIFKVIRQRFVELKQSLPARLVFIGREVPADMEYLVTQSLPGLAEDDLPTFLSDHGVTLSRELAHQLWEHTGGNPKLLELAAGSLVGLPESAAGNFIASLVRKSDIRDYLMTNIYAALTPEEQVVMSALAVFPGPIERVGVEEILEGEGVSRIVPHLDALANKHVLTVDENDQIDCHDLVREYCYHVLSRRDRDRFHQRAAAYFEQEQNWLAAAYHHFERRDSARALDLLTTHADAIINAGKVAALSEQFARFNLATLTPEQRVQLHRTHGNCYRIRGEYPRAIHAFEAGLEETSSDETRLQLLLLIGTTHLKQGDYDKALAYATRGLRLSEQTTGNRRGIAEAHHDIGWASYRLDQMARAREHFTISLDIAQQVNDKVLIAKANLGLGLIDWREGHLSDGQARFEISRRISREGNDKAREAHALINLGVILGELKKTDQQLAYYREATRIYQEIGDVDGLRIALNNVGDIHYTHREYGLAQYYFDELVQLSRDTGHQRMLSTAYQGLADVYLAQDQLPQALSAAQSALQAAQEAGSGVELGISYRVLGDVCLKQHDLNQARAFYAQSLPLLEQAHETTEVLKARQGYELTASQSGN